MLKPANHLAARLIVVVTAALFSAFLSASELAVGLQPTENGVTFSLTNNSAKTVSVLVWETPLEPELTQDVFELIPERQDPADKFVDRARYSGRLIKRGIPKTSDFVELKAGQTVSSDIALADYYRLDVDGAHRVRFRGEFNVVESKVTDRTILAHGTGHAHVIGAKLISMQSAAVDVALVSTPERAFARVGGFNSCSASQQAEISSDLDASEVITREAISALENLPVNERPSSPRYLQWFGTYSALRYNTVLDTYQTAAARMADGSVEFNCDCNEEFFAFVFPIDPYKVYLCNAYWRADQLGTDSRAGTILHELSHFPEIGDTNDFAYGAVDVSNLAISNPNNAVFNADSIEYFAENTPVRAISAGVAPETVTSYQTLARGAAVTTSVDIGASNLYQLTGADSVRLTTLSGDADLYVYDSATADNEVCRSILTSAVDECDVAGLSTVYVVVRGFVTSDYRLESVAALEPIVVPQSNLASGGSGGGFVGPWVSVFLGWLLLLQRVRFVPGSVSGDKRGALR